MVSKARLQYTMGLSGCLLSVMIIPELAELRAWIYRSRFLSPCPPENSWKLVCEVFNMVNFYCVYTKSGIQFYDPDQENHHVVTKNYASNQVLFKKHYRRIVRSVAGSLRARFRTSIRTAHNPVFPVLRSKF